MIWKSRALWTAIIDALFSIALIIVGIQFPASLETVKALIVPLQLVAAALIAAFTVDDTVKLIAAVKVNNLPYINARLK